LNDGDTGSSVWLFIKARPEEAWEMDLGFPAATYRVLEEGSGGFPDLPLADPLTARTPAMVQPQALAEIYKTQYTAPWTRSRSLSLGTLARNFEHSRWMPGDVPGSNSTRCNAASCQRIGSQ
jgi:hypothetical protein